MGPDDNIVMDDLTNLVESFLGGVFYKTVSFEFDMNIWECVITVNNIGGEQNAVFFDDSTSVTNEGNIYFMIVNGRTLDEVVKAAYRRLLAVSKVIPMNERVDRGETSQA